MGKKSFIWNDQSYETVVMHCAKYANCGTSGILLGEMKDGSVFVRHAVPLFHIHISPISFTVALTMIERFAKQLQLQIVGYYISPLNPSEEELLQSIQLKYSQIISKNAQQNNFAIFYINAENMVESKNPFTLMSLKNGAVVPMADSETIVHGSAFELALESIRNDKYSECMFDFNDHFENIRVVPYGLDN